MVAGIPSPAQSESHRMFPGLRLLEVNVGARLGVDTAG